MRCRESLGIWWGKKKQQQLDVEEPDTWNDCQIFPSSIYSGGFTVSLQFWCTLFPMLSLPVTSVTWPACRIKCKKIEYTGLWWPKRCDSEWRVTFCPSGGYIITVTPSLNDGRLFASVIVTRFHWKLLEHPVQSRRSVWVQDSRPFVRTIVRCALSFVYIVVCDVNCKYNRTSHNVNELFECFVSSCST